jgi:hypothetical protein
LPLFGASYGGRRTCAVDGRAKTDHVPSCGRLHHQLNVEEVPTCLPRVQASAGLAYTFPLNLQIPERVIHFRYPNGLSSWATQKDYPRQMHREWERYRQETPVPMAPAGATPPMTSDGAGKMPPAAAALVLHAPWRHVTLSCAP